MEANQSQDESSGSPHLSTRINEVQQYSTKTKLVVSDEGDEK